MLLARLLDGVHVRKLFAELYGRMVPTQDLNIRSIQYDSRNVGPNDLFVAIRGTALDGHQFIDRSIAQGAVAVVVDDDLAVPDAVFHHAGAFKIVVPDSREALATLSANYYGRPSRRLHLVGVTGTNGKTTTTYLVKSILEASGEKVGLIGTIEYRIADEALPATHTTPESLELQKLLAEMVARGCSSVVMEVSSHALVMRRVHGMDFQVGIFTNLTQDHLDFHGTLEEYFRAKKLLFDSLSSSATAVVNADDPYGLRIASGEVGRGARQLTYGTVGPADLTADATQIGIQGMTLCLRHRDQEHVLETSLTGRFNVLNVLAACGAGVALGVPWEAIRTGIRNLASVRGRFEQIASPEGWTAIVDYAHTPDALEHILQAIRDVLPPGASSRIITVFGCGGDRDRGKRPVMGRISTAMSDVTIVTSDNPRHEDPGDIIRQITAGAVAGRTILTEVDRRTAIRRALGMAHRGDVVLIAGKGHEQYQVIGQTRSRFDDREEVETVIRHGA